MWNKIGQFLSQFIFIHVSRRELGKAQLDVPCESLCFLGTVEVHIPTVDCHPFVELVDVYLVAKKGKYLPMDFRKSDHVSLAPRTRISEHEMRVIFNKNILPRINKGGLKVIIRRDKHPSKTKAQEPHCTRTQELSYLEDGREIARVHQYKRTDGTLGASGLPDPKRIFVDGVQYLLPKKKINLPN